MSATICCKIVEAQIIKVDCENILNLRKIFKLTIEMKKINPKENRHKTPRFTWFGNNLHSRTIMNKFYYNKFRIIQISVEELLQTQIPNTSKQPSLTNTKPKNQIQTKDLKVHKYQKQITHKSKRESQIKSKSYNMPKESKAQIIKL